MENAKCETELKLKKTKCKITFYPKNRLKVMAVYSSNEYSKN